jgi:hypothetical protein
MNTIARLAALERQKPATEPFTVLIMVFHDGTTRSASTATGTATPTDRSNAGRSSTAPSRSRTA